ncbi:MAG: hypothetical protein HDR09_12385 [Lachnospiraceae bacterium]|nr:hypothetical protein [Lachnospiraceae bacterium]
MAKKEQLTAKNTDKIHGGRVPGSMESLSALQLTADMGGMDGQSKTLLHNKEVLAIILQETVEEYKGYGVSEIVDFIEADSIVESGEVSTGRTNTQIRGDNPEFVQLNEKTSNFDIIFRAKNPCLSNGKVIVNLHIDVEPQKTYRPGYPVEKRGIYYLARSLSSQLSLVTETTDYNRLEKCYSIWICRDDIPAGEQYSVSFYKMTNTNNIGNYVCTEKDGKERNYDLLELVIIRLGDEAYHGKEGDEGFGLMRFLNAVMYPHKEDFMDTISEYIDFSNNEELWKGAERMEGLGQSILEEGIARGREEGREEGIEQGIRLSLFLRVCRKLAKGKRDFEIAEALEEPEDVIQELCEKALEYAPEYDEDKIRKDWLNQ